MPLIPSVVALGRGLPFLVPVTLPAVANRLELSVVTAVSPPLTGSRQLRLAVPQA